MTEIQPDFAVIARFQPVPAVDEGHGTRCEEAKFLYNVAEGEIMQATNPLKDQESSPHPPTESDWDALDRDKSPGHPLVGFLLLTAVSFLYVQIWIWLFRGW